MPADRTQYVKLVWVNDQTKLNATNLNHIEVGVETNNALAKENALYIDEIYAALITYFSIVYDHTTRALSYNIGDETETPRFHLTGSIALTNNFYDKTEIDTLLATKQTSLVSASNIKTINGVSILGSGNISFDSELNGISTNAPQTKIVKEALDNKLDKSTINSVIYGVNNSGDQSTFNLDTTSSGETTFGIIPRRRGNADGNIPVPLEPLVNNDAASKKYVDDHHDSTKQNVLTFDNAPTNNSNNPVKSSGIYSALAGKQDKLTAGVGISIDANGVINNTGSSTQISVTIVNTLPGAGFANVIYLVPTSNSSTNNLYDEYMYINNTWERIGSTQIDLTNYYNKSEVDTAIGAKQDALSSGTNIKTINNNSILGSGNINIEAGAMKLTGTTLEDMEYTAGQLYYCTESSDSFTADTLYLAKGTSSIYPISTGNAISTTPAILTFTISPSTTEAGNTVTPTYSYTLKKYSAIRNVKLDGTLISETPSSSSGSGTASSSSNKTYTLTAEYGTSGSLSKSATLTPYFRQYYGAVSGDSVATVLTNLKNVISDSNTLKTKLQNSLPSSISLSLGSTPVYVYLIVKSSLSINTLKSGGFDVPFSLLDTTNFTNYYNSTYQVKVYRTDNKVFGDMTLNIN